MANPAADFSEPAPEDRGPLAFEQPLTERIRTFLRIEFLYRQAQFHCGDGSEFGARAAVGSLLEILSILGRGDVRSEVIKELDRHAEVLGHYRRTPGIDVARLKGLMDEIDALKYELVAAGNHFMNPLKENEFLNAIKHRSTIPGGTCMFDLPEYGYWLRSARSDRNRQLAEWLGQLTPLCRAIGEVLWLTREATEPVECVAYGGLYHHSLARNEQYNLVRVLLPAKSMVFPEISAGQHRFTVRFEAWLGVESRPKQVTDDVRFKLALC
jgi:cell division protein ZapD